MSWRSDYGLDVKKYQALNGGGALKQILTEQGLWVLLVYRIEAAVYRSALPRIIKRPLLLLLVVAHKIIEICTGINLPCTARVGPGMHLPHCGYRVVNGEAEIGADCCLTQGVTIGVSGRGERRGVPKIGDRVYIGANATVVGKIVIGDDVVIAANSLVNRDVPNHCTVVGVPARVANNRGSEEYIPVLTASKAPQAAPVEVTPEPVPCK
jgi:serine O-acetyltransferase